jgi:hypothetical protein
MGKTKAGVTNSFTPTAAGSGENAAFGEESAEPVELTQSDWDPLVAVVQPAGRAGAETPSKF